MTRYGRSFLSTEQTDLYDSLLLFLEQPTHGDYFTPMNTLTSDEIASTITTLQDDYADYYWAKFIPLAPNDYTNIRFEFAEQLTTETVAAQKIALEQRAATFLDSHKNASDVELALLIHDEIAETVVYFTGQHGPYRGTAYGALIDGGAYCNGYAKAFQYLADRAGLNNIYLRGRDRAGTAHAWNAVELDDKWYYIDTTWDRSSNSYGGSYHDFFAITWAESSSKRIWDSSQYPLLPPADSRDANFYIMKDYVIYVNDTISIADDLERIADIYSRQLLAKDNIQKDFSYAFLEIRILGSRENYLRWKDAYIKEVFQVLRETQAAAEEKGYPFEISYDTTVSCYFNDSMQILAFYPKVKTKDGS